MPVGVVHRANRSAHTHSVRRRLRIHTRQIAAILAWPHRPGCRRTGVFYGLPPRSSAWSEPVVTSAKRVALRFSVASARRAWKQASPADHAGIAGPGGYLFPATLPDVTEDRSRRTPLLRFLPLQRSPATLRCPGLPTSGHSRFGVLSGQVSHPHAKCSGDHCRMFVLAVFRRSAGPSSTLDARLAGCRSPQVMHRRRISADVPLPLLANCVAWPGRHGPAALLGFNPSQCYSCPRADQASPPVLLPTCRSSQPPPRSFSSRDQPSVFTSLARLLGICNGRSRRPGFGFWV